MVYQHIAVCGDVERTFVLVPCTVLIKRRPRRMGKYGVTVARSDELRVTMELAADADLSCLLLDLGYTQA